MDLFNIESIDTVIQLIATLICVIISVMRALATKKRAWVMLFFTAFIYFLGDLYWQIFVVVHGHIPEYSYIPYLSWYASYLFFILLLVEVRAERDKRKESPVLWPVPAFTVGMAVLYMQKQDYIGNIICLILMTVLIWQAVSGLLDKSEKKKRLLYLAVLLFCFEEYAMWTSSFFIAEESIRNPYYWADIAMSLTFVFMPAALSKAVDR